MHASWQTAVHQLAGLLPGLLSSKKNAEELNCHAAANDVRLRLLLLLLLLLMRQSWMHVDET